MTRQKDIDQYLKSYPELLKWINECPVCHFRGYKPDMPEHIGGEHSMAERNIRRFFRPLEVNEAGLCMVCARLQKKYHTDH